MTIEILLSHGCVTIVDDEDADLALVRWYARAPASNKGGGFYACHHVRRPSGEKAYEYLHRIIIERVLERPLERKEEVDHRDGDTLNNRRNNLRVASRVQNSANKGVNKNNRSGYRGVSFEQKTGQWGSRIEYDGTFFWLGRYDSAEDAAIVYNHALADLAGEFGRFNDVPDWRNKLVSPSKTLLRKHNTSGHEHIHFCHKLNKWRVYARINGRRKHIGYFSSMEEALLAQQTVYEKEV